MIESLMLVPLSGAVVAFLAPARKAWAGMAAAAATCALAILAVMTVYGDGAVGAQLGGWPAPLGIELHLDGLGALMVGMTGISGLVISVFAAGYFADERERHVATPLFWPLWLTLWATLNGLFMAGDIFTLYVLLEVNLLAAVALATLEAGQTAAVAALRYLLLAMVGSMLYLFGVALLYDAHGILDYRLLAAALEQSRIETTALGLMTVGLLAKTALFPFHFWLPPAHASAPAPVSAILSGLVIKAAFFVLVRIWMTYGDMLPPVSTHVIAALCVGAIIWGSLQAMRQQRLKMLIAYSTVAQVGFFVAALAALVPDAGMSADPRAWAGGAIQATSHALAKVALFLGAGIVILALGRDELMAMRGAWQRLPVTVVTLALAGAALFGVPWSGADLGKTMIVAAADTGEPWWVYGIEYGSWLTLLYVGAMLRYAVTGSPTNRSWRAVPLWLQLGPLLLALSSLTLGLHEEFVTTLLAATGGPAS